MCYIVVSVVEYLAKLHYGTHTSKILGSVVFVLCVVCTIHCCREAEERARVGKSPAVDERQSSVYPRRRHYHRSHVRMIIVTMSVINSALVFQRSHHGYSGTVSHVS